MAARMRPDIVSTPVHAVVAVAPAVSMLSFGRDSGLAGS